MAKARNGESRADVSLKEYTDTRVEAVCADLGRTRDDMRVYINTRFDASESASALAREVLQHQLNVMNEFRSTLSDQAAQFTTRGEHAMVIARIDSLDKAQAKAEGKADQSSVNLAYLIAMAGIALSGISIILGVMHI